MCPRLLRRGEEARRRRRRQVQFQVVAAGAPVYPRGVRRPGQPRPEAALAVVVEAAAAKDHRQAAHRQVRRPAAQPLGEGGPELGRRRRRQPGVQVAADGDDLPLRTEGGPLHQQVFRHEAVPVGPDVGRLANVLVEGEQGVAPARRRPGQGQGLGVAPPIWPGRGEKRRRRRRRTRRPGRQSVTLVAGHLQAEAAVAQRRQGVEQRRHQPRHLPGAVGLADEQHVGAGRQVEKRLQHRRRQVIGGQIHGKNSISAERPPSYPRDSPERS